MDTLRKAMAPVMFRKSRADIAEFLPQIIPMELPVVLSPTVMSLYRFIADDCLRVINEALANGAMGSFNVLAAYGHEKNDSGNMARGEIMSRITCMRLLCANPALLSMSADNFDDEDSRTGSRYASWLKRNGYLDSVVGNEKLDVVTEQVRAILDESPDNRVVVFSYFKPMLRMIGQALKSEPHVYLTGDYTPQQRAHSLDRFKNDVRVLLSSDAGQYGVDLPHVNYLISYDLPWSAGAFAQRSARIDRTSSLFPHITVITMMSQDTIEQRQYDMLVQKRKISEAWIDGQHVDAKGNVTLTLESLKQFLGS
jgi:SNF2 family DNA or RNA helicase